MSVLESEFLRWVDLVADLSRSPALEFPDDLISRRLSESLGTGASYTWLDPDGSVGFRVPDHSSDWVPDWYVERWFAGGVRHPLARWFMVTGDSTAMTIGRVPERLAPRRVIAALADDLRPFGIEQQLSVPCMVDPTAYAAFVMATTGVDFTDEQLAVARRVQPLLVMLHRQWRCAQRVAAASGLTAREAAVLDLLVQGATSMAIGRALGISPRTAEKHLGNVYRKLGVRDRLSAAMVAREAGLLTDRRQAAPQVSSRRS